jgi:hypothetical protein
MRGIFWKDLPCSTVHDVTQRQQHQRIRCSLRCRICQQPGTDPTSLSCYRASPMLQASQLLPNSACCIFFRSQSGASEVNRHRAFRARPGAAQSPLASKKCSAPDIAPDSASRGRYGYRSYLEQVAICQCSRSSQPRVGAHPREAVCAGVRAGAGPGSRAWVDGARSANLAQNLCRRGHKLHTACIGKLGACKAGSSPEFGHQGSRSCVRVRDRHRAGL